METEREPFGFDYRRMPCTSDIVRFIMCNMHEQAGEATRLPRLRVELWSVLTVNGNSRDQGVVYIITKDRHNSHFGSSFRHQHTEIKYEKQTNNNKNAGHSR